MVKVSVVIPTYNRADYLPIAITSVLSQTFGDLEVIIIDDGSTDATQNVVGAMQDPRVHYIRKEHAGISAALNFGWRVAQGEFIGIVGSDDVWLPNLLEELLPRLQSAPNVAVAYARAQWMDANGNLLPQLLGAPEKFPGQMLKSLLYGDFVNPIAVIIRRACLEAVGGYDESLMGNEDWDLWIRLAESYRFVYCDKVLAHYRVHPQNLTQSRAEHNSRLLQDRIRVLEKFYARPNLPPEAAAVKPLAFRNLYQDIALRHVSARRWRAAIHSYVRSIQVAPNPLAAVLRGARDVIYFFSIGKTHWGTQLADAWVAAQKRKDTANNF